MSQEGSKYASIEQQQAAKSSGRIRPVWRPQNAATTENTAKSKNKRAASATLTITQPRAQCLQLETKRKRNNLDGIEMWTKKVKRTTVVDTKIVATNAFLIHTLEESATRNDTHTHTDSHQRIAPIRHAYSGVVASNRMRRLQWKAGKRTKTERLSRCSRVKRA